MHAIPLLLLVSLSPSDARAMVASAAEATLVEREDSKPIPTKEELAKLPKDGGPEFNRLVFEKSPYLLQHARNPIDWYAWGDEAFARAAAEDKPILLSIGYSTCHWCHVMAHESFEDAEVARLLNASFVCIKVDREERPDVDNVYMSASRALSGAAGWPLTIFMTPEKEPFFGGTYFPKTGSSGRIGFQDLVQSLAKAWQEQRANLVAQAQSLRARLVQEAKRGTGPVPDRGAIERAWKEFDDSFDTEFGGLGRPPKFYQTARLSLWMRRSTVGTDLTSLAKVLKTLDAMRLGGVYDQVGGGFHRYSTDREWIVPHFEKMLYDQAMIAFVNTEAWRLAHRDLCEETVRDIFAYVLRDLSTPEGAFAGAEDADSEGAEGAFYRWTKDELVAALGPEDGAWATQFFGVEISTGAKAPAESLGVLRLTRGFDLYGPDGAADRERLARVRARLFKARAQRTRPALDDKIVVQWNGYAIAALAFGARTFAVDEWAKAAGRAADFVLARCRDEKGQLARRYRDGQVAGKGTLDDHAALIWGLIELYEATFDPARLEQALALAQSMITNFEDSKRGGFHMTAEGSEPLLVRPIEAFDGAHPSGNGLAANVLVRLARLTGRSILDAKARKTVGAFASEIARGPAHASSLLAALDTLLEPSLEIVIVGQPGAEDTQALLEVLRTRYLPHAAILFRPADEAEPAIARLAPFVKDMRAVDGKATAYVCRDFACLMPVTSSTALEDVLYGLVDPVAPK